MVQTEVKLARQLAGANLQLEEINEPSKSGEKEDIFTAYDQLVDLIKQAKDTTVNYLSELDKKLDFIKQWTAEQKSCIQPFWDVWLQIKDQVNEIDASESKKKKVENEACIQQKINEDQREYRLQQQKELEEAARWQREWEEEWHIRKIESSLDW